MILYPTETVYGLGVHALDDAALSKLYTLKGRDAAKSVSWLVRDIADIERFAYLSARARAIAERFLPGPLTLVLPVRNATDAVSQSTIGFRISTDPIAERLIAEFMEEHDAPLTCTSANVSGMPTMPTPIEILAQFGEKASEIDRVLDGGPRTGISSTVVRVVNDEVVIHREGAIPSKEVHAVL